MHLAEYKDHEPFTYLVLMRAAEGIVESLRLLLHENLVAIMDIKM